MNGCKTLRSRLRSRRIATRPVESKPNSTMIKTNRIGSMLIASPIIDKKSPRREWQQEHEATDLRWRTRRKSPGLRLGRLDLSSWYYLKHPKINISQTHEISRTMFLPSTRRVSAVDSEGRIIWIADTHRGDGKRFVVRADEKLTAFVELERAIYELAVDAISGDFTTPLKLPLCSSRLDHVAGPAMRRRRNFSTRKRPPDATSPGTF